MALLAEELVEEWLNRQGFFTIRGLAVGHGEIDLLAVRMREGRPECRHVEVQASVKPIGYVCGPPLRKSPEQMRADVLSWIAKKFRHDRKLTIRRSLCAAAWSEELVVNVVKHDDELEAIKASGVRIHRLREVIHELLNPPRDHLRAGRSDFVDLLVRPASEVPGP